MAGAVARGVARVMRWGTVGAVDFRVFGSLAQKVVHDHTSLHGRPYQGHMSIFEKSSQKKKISTKLIDIKKSAETRELRKLMSGYGSVIL